MFPCLLSSSLTHFTQFPLALTSISKIHFIHTLLICLTVVPHALSKPVSCQKAQKHKLLIKANYCKFKSFYPGTIWKVMDAFCWDGTEYQRPAAKVPPNRISGQLAAGSQQNISRLKLYRVVMLEIIRPSNFANFNANILVSCWLTVR